MRCWRCHRKLLSKAFKDNYLLISYSHHIYICKSCIDHISIEKHVKYNIKSTNHKKIVQYIANNYIHAESDIPRHNWQNKKIEFRKFLGIIYYLSSPEQWEFEH